MTSVQTLRCSDGSLFKKFLKFSILVHRLKITIAANVLTTDVDVRDCSLTRMTRQERLYGLAVRHFIYLDRFDLDFACFEHTLGAVTVWTV